LVVRVIDDGTGLPDGFDLDRSTGLGLSIVRTLVSSELGGSIRLWSGDYTTDRPGTTVELLVPLRGNGAESIE
jgi:two-component system, sensor histidine kinase PdtaS